MKSINNNNYDLNKRNEQIIVEQKIIIILNNFEKIDEIVYQLKFIKFIEDNKNYLYYNQVLDLWLNLTLNSNDEVTHYCLTEEKI